jgi:hypothetical protein
MWKLVKWDWNYSQGPTFYVETCEVGLELQTGPDVLCGNLFSEHSNSSKGKNKGKKLLCYKLNCKLYPSRDIFFVSYLVCGMGTFKK